MEQASQLLHISPLQLGVLLIWSTIWQGLGLYRAAKYGQKYWFIAILFIHTIGLLEITYLFFFCKKKLRLEDLKP